MYYMTSMVNEIVSKESSKKLLVTLTRNSQVADDVSTDIRVVANFANIQIIALCHCQALFVIYIAIFLFALSKVGDWSMDLICCFYWL